MRGALRVEPALILPTEERGHDDRRGQIST
jgi:hypothetical protein